MTSPVGAVVGVDLGGSGCRAAVVLGERRWRGTGPGARVSVDGLDVDAVVSAAALAVIDALAVGDALAPAERAPLAVDGPVTVALGTTGLLTLADRPADLPAALADRLGAVLGARVHRTLVVSDTLTALVGGLGAVAPGAIVAAGTGAVALGTDLAGTWNRVDGWGHLVGDDGGGAWVGAAGLRAALRAHDGRPGGSVALLAACRTRFGDPDDLPRQLYPHPDRAGRLASFAPLVAAAAHDGDPVAVQVLAGAGALLAESLVAAAPGDVVVATWTGGLFDVGDLLLAPFREAVAATAPDLVLTPPVGTGLDGAVLLARAAAVDAAAVPRVAPYLVLTDH